VAVTDSGREPGCQIDWRPGARMSTLVARARLLADIRAFMARSAILEVDTGVIGRAPPAERGLEALIVQDAGYLVSSPEHALKRLLAAGSGPIYQLGHVFRAGEIGRWHNPEFCMLEWYRPDCDMTDIVIETQALIETLTGERFSTTLCYRAVFQAQIGIDPFMADTAALAAAAEQLDVAPTGIGSSVGRAFWLDLLMSLVVQPTLGHAGPVCVTGFPADDAVLVELNPELPGSARRFECFWRGVELANGAQELTDAETARHRMALENEARRAQGTLGAGLDERLVAALAAGLPRCAGVALGVDRLLTLIGGHDSLSEVMPFDWSRR